MATKILAFRLSEDLYAKLEKLAKKDDRSIANYARKIMAAALKGA